MTTRVPYSMTDAPLNVRAFGAKGDGVTNDTAAIQATIAAAKALGGATLHFPEGSYKVVFPAGIAAYSSLFALPSNTSIEFDAGASITASAVTGSTLFAAVFGVDQTALPVSNLRFTGVRIAQTAPGAGQELGAGIMLQVAPNTAANSVSNVVIERCDFQGTASAIYILQRTSAGTATRQVIGVKIHNCTGLGNYSGITADGADIEITGNTLVGSTSSPATYYDGVSIHSGRNVRIVGNHLSHYGEFGVNVRNSPNNLCGSSNIVIAHNTIAECTLKGIGVYTTAGETAYGVSNVSVTGNTVSHSTNGNRFTSAGVCALRPLTGTWSLAQARIEAFGGTPASGTWAVGDRVYGTPTAGGTIGVVCTTAGTPGTWKTFGAIAA